MCVSLHVCGLSRMDSTFKQSGDGKNKKGTVVVGACTQLLRQPVTCHVVSLSDWLTSSLFWPPGPAKALETPWPTPVHAQHLAIRLRTQRCTRGMHL